MVNPGFIRLLTSYFLLVLAVLLTACGGGGGGSGGSVTPAGNGSVGILLTDKPTSLDQFSGVMMSVTRVELFNADTGEKVVAYDGRPRGPFNLLRLRNESKPLTFHDRVPSGRYCKIRLILDDLWLTFKDGSPDYHPHLPGNNKLDLNARDCFYVSAGKMIYVQLDMDMSKSIHVVKRGNRDEYNVRPVVFIDVVGNDFKGKLVRLEGGSVEAVNRAEGTLLVCDALPVFHDGIASRRDECVKVFIGSDTSAFDNDTNDGNSIDGGDAIPLADAFAPERVGSGPVTVVGYFRTDSNSVYADRRDDSDSDDSDSGDDSNGDFDAFDSDEDSEDRLRYLSFDAVVVEFGEFLNLDGEVDSTAGTAEVNEALNAAPTVSSTSRPERQFQANDGIVEVGNGWLADSVPGPHWIRLDFDSAKTINRVALTGLINLTSQLQSVRMEFSDNSTLDVDLTLPSNDGLPQEFDIDPPKRTDWIKFTITQVTASSYGFAEIATYSTVGTDDGFSMRVLPGQGYSSTDPLPVVLQDAPTGGNGTKILSRSGEPLTPAAIEVGMPVTVDGVLSGPDPVFLNSALVIVDTDALSKDIASGTIDRVGINSLLLEANSFVCEPGTGPGFYVVNFNDTTDIYEITESGSGIEGEFVGTDELETGQEIDISGNCVNNELHADTIVILP